MLLALVKAHPLGELMAVLVSGIFFWGRFSKTVKNRNFGAENEARPCPARFLAVNPLDAGGFPR
jgi:hypothetical protein